MKAAKLKASKEERKNTTGIKLNDRITWWAEMNGKPGSLSIRIHPLFYLQMSKTPDCLPDQMTKERKKRNGKRNAPKVQQ